jgi:menaquinone-dependent protoporphyrinogen oxidase
MRILITTSSKYGATTEIGERIAGVLRQEGHEVETSDAAAVESFEGWDAVVMGGAVYAGRWPREGRQLIERLGQQLSGASLWLFSSGPLGDPPKPEGPPEGMNDLLAPLGARDHAVFAGRLDKSVLGLGDRAIVGALRAPEGDFRPWAEIDEWARGIHRAMAG